MGKLGRVDHEKQVIKLMIEIYCRKNIKVIISFVMTVRNY